MIYIDTENTSDPNFRQIISEFYTEIPKYILLEEIGEIIKEYLIISLAYLAKTKSFQNRKIQIANPYLVVLIQNESSLIEHDMDPLIQKYRIYKIIVTNSKLKSFSINQNLSIEKEIRLELSIKNSSIDYFILSINKLFLMRNHTIIPEFENLTTLVTKIVDNFNTINEIGNINTYILYLNSANLIIANSNFSIPIFQKSELTLKNSYLKFPSNLPNFGDFEKKLNSIYGKFIKINISEIASSLKYLKNLHDSAIFSTDIDRLYSYLETRKALSKKILYWYTKYYYNILIPSLGLAISLFLFQIILQNTNEINIHLGLENALFPYDLFKNIVFKDFKVTWNFNRISFEKIVLLILASNVYFSIFSISLAIKRRFGYNKI